MAEKNFVFEWGNGLVKFDSLSPNKKYYYLIKKPTDLYWGLFVAKISFYSIDKDLIYYNNSFYADPLIDEKSNNSIKYANYSKTGDLVYFRERKNINLINHILLDLKNNKFKLVLWTKSNSTKSIKLEKMSFDETDLELFDNLEWNSAIKNIRYKKNIFGKTNWFPKIK